MRALFIKILIALAVVLIILIISTPVIVQRVIRRQLTAFVKESCGSCTLSLDRVHLSVMPFSVILEGVRLAGGDPKTTRVDAEAERIVALSTLRSLVSGADRWLSRSLFCLFFAASHDFDDEFSDLLRTRL